jgi:hypothetical protein
MQTQEEQSIILCLQAPKMLCSAICIFSGQARCTLAESDDNLFSELQVASGLLCCVGTTAPHH